MAVQEAPRFETTRPANKGRSFTTAQVNAVTVLDTIAASRLPNFGPQLVELHNKDLAAASVVTVTLQDGTDFVVDLGPNETRPIPTPVKAFKTAAPATVTANAYWWIYPEKGDHNYSPVTNP